MRHQHRGLLNEARSFERIAKSIKDSNDPPPHWEIVLAGCKQRAAAAREELRRLKSRAWVELRGVSKPKRRRK